MTTNVIEVSGLTRQFNGLTAVNEVSFDVKEGEILGFLGPNGDLRVNRHRAVVAVSEQVSRYAEPDGGAPGISARTVRFDRHQTRPAVPSRANPIMS